MEKRTFTAEWAVPIAHHALNPLDHDSILFREPLSGSIPNAIHESFLWLRQFSLEAHSARSAGFQSISICPGRRAPRRFLVAQICNLLYRRIVFCGGLERVSRGVTPNGQPIANRRYGRVQLCATLVAAPPRCAVSRICNPQSSADSRSPWGLDGPPTASRRHSRLKICAASGTRSEEQSALPAGVLRDSNVARPPAVP